MTLIEVLVALVVFSAVMAGALGFLRSQSRGFSLGNQRMTMLQNVRFAANLLEQDLRTVGASLPDIQPFLVYVGPNVVAFNADHTTNVANDAFAVYYDRDAPAGAVTALTKAQRIGIPQSSFVYPDTTYGDASGMNSPGETIIFYFERDTSTARQDDYALYRQVNNQKPELVARNLLETPGRPFFEYFVLVTPPSAPRDIRPLSGASLPLRHSVPIHLSPADTGATARIDSVRAVRVSVTGTNGLSGADERRRTITRLIRLPNAGLATRRTCGDEPLFGSGLTATATVLTGGAPAVNLEWTAAIDESAGEQDVVRYVIWRRLSSEPAWGDPYLSVPAGNALYVYTDAAVESGATYVYAAAAQDCTPLRSQLAVSAPVSVP